jgi:hypothetical protein
VRFPKRTASTLSTLTSASIAALAQALALLAHPTLQNNFYLQAFTPAFSAGVMCVLGGF